MAANTSVAAIAGGVGVRTVEFHGRPIPPGYLIDGRDPWYPSVAPIGKRIADPWGRTMRRVAETLREWRAGGAQEPRGPAWPGRRAVTAVCPPRVGPRPRTPQQLVTCRQASRPPS